MPDRHPSGAGQSLGVRLAVAGGGALAMLVPFGLLLALVAGNADWLHRADQRISDSFHVLATGHGGLVRAMEVWSFAFDPNVWRLAALVLVIWLLRRGSRSLALWTVVTMAAGGLLGVVLKLLVGRNRPAFLDPVARAAGYSFPSGHALNNALGAAVFLLVLLPLTRDRPVARRAMWLAAAVLPLITGLARVGLGVHWASDVVAGWLFGAAVPAATAWAYLAWQGRGGDLQDAAEQGLAPELAEGPIDEGPIGEGRHAQPQPK
jgi:membrane-associated phospholipid phosphatase